MPWNPEAIPKIYPVTKALNVELCLPGGNNTGQAQQYQVLVLCGSKSQYRHGHMPNQILLNTKACFVRAINAFGVHFQQAEP